MSLRRKALAATLALATSFSLAACAGGNDEDTIVIGTTDSEQKQWTVFKDELDKAGLKTEIKAFNDYSIPNRALADGDIDVNNFQHMMFLAEYNVGNNTDLTPVGATEILPLGLYYKEHSELKDVEEAGEVTIPNDSTNQGRAINVLVQAGLVALKKEGLLTPTPADIDEGKSKVKVIAVDAAQTATSWLDGKPAIVNNSFLDRAKIDPKTVIFQDDPKKEEAQPYINGFVTTKERKDEADLKKLVEIWHSKPVQDAIDEQSKGTSVEVNMDSDELNEVVKDTEQKIKDQK